MSERSIEVKGSGEIFLYKGLEEGAYILGIGSGHEYAEVKLSRDHMLPIIGRIGRWLDED